MDVLGIISALFSIFGGIFSGFQAVKSKNAAKAAEAAKESVQAKVTAFNLTDLYSKAKNIETILIRSTSKNAISACGRNSAKEIQEIEMFISVLNENKGVHKDEKLDKTICDEYDYLSKANSQDPRPYRDMLYHLRNVIEELNKFIKQKTYS